MCCCKTGICSAADRASATGSRTNSVKRFGLCFSSFASQQELLKRYRSFLYLFWESVSCFPCGFVLRTPLKLSLKHWQPQKWNCAVCQNVISFQIPFSDRQSACKSYTWSTFNFTLPSASFINEFESLVFFVATAPGCVCFCAWADNPGVICNHFQSSQFQWR